MLQLFIAVTQPEYLCQTMVLLHIPEWLAEALSLIPIISMSFCLN